MNPLFKNSLIAILAAATPVLAGEPPKPAPAPVKPVVRSIFILPTSYREGRDPFFPESQRLYEELAPKRAVDAMTYISFKGASMEGGHWLAIINNHSFGPGDEGDVFTPDHTKVHLRVISIEAESVVVECNGTRREIKLIEK